MKNRFAALVKYKHSIVQTSEAELQKANVRLYKAKLELQKSLEDLEKLPNPTKGNMQEFLASRSIADAQMRLIEKNRDWVAFEEKQVEAAKEQLKADTIEYEKYKYLQSQEIQKLKKQQAIAEAKQLDEVALMTFNQKEAV
jgi:flagellar biosynthesis chaperone FliJ